MAELVEVVEGQGIYHKLLLVALLILAVAVVVALEALATTRETADQELLFLAIQRRM
jgi:hypothetical protein